MNLLRVEGRDADGRLSAQLWLERSRWYAALRRTSGCLCSARDLDAIELGYRCLLEGELGGWLSAGLVVTDKTQNDAEAGPGEQATVLSVGNLPYLAEDLRVEGGALEEGYGALASDNAQLVGIG